MVSERFWRRHFAGRAELAGATIRVGQKLHTIAGVMRPGFDFPFGSDVWVPREQSDKRSGRTGRNSRAVARLGPDVTLAQARSDLSAIAKHLKRQYGDDTRMLDVDLVPLQEEMVASVRPALLIQLVAVGFLLLVACANVLNLLAARAAARGRELAVRAALGAGRWRLVRQSVVESGMLSMAGCALGVLAAVWSLALIKAIAPAHLPRISELAVGWPVVGFALAAAIAISLLLGLAVAWRTAARQLHLSLHESPAAPSGTMRRIDSGTRWWPCRWPSRSCCSWVRDC